MFNLFRLRHYLSYSGSTLKRGEEYYREGRIKDVKLYEVNGNYTVEASIKGSLLYTTQIKFTKSLDYNGYKCNCPVYQGSSGICKHVAALFVHLENTKEFDRLVNFIAAEDFLKHYLERPQEASRQKITLEYQIKLEHYWNSSTAYLSLKAGRDRLYVVKNLRSFLELMDKGEGIMEFGKSFSYNPSIHEIKEEDREIIDFLMDVYSAEKAIKSESYYGQGGIFSGKSVKLNENLLIKILRLFGGRGFELIAEEQNFGLVWVDFKETPVQIEIEKAGQNVKARIKYEEDVVHVRGWDNLIISENKLYVLDRSNKLYPFIASSLARNTDTLEFTGERSRMFLSMLPGIVENEGVKVSRELAESYVRMPLEAEIYLSRHKKGVALDPQFRYGDTRYNPILDTSIDPYIIRDYEKEEHIMNLIDDGGFKVHEDTVYLDDLDKVYIFFRDIVPILMNYCGVFYTDDVKSMYLGRIRGVKSYARVKNGVIDINIDIEGIDKKEVRELLKSLKEKKKYHKFKNGQLISLEGEEIRELSNLVEGIETDEIKGNTIVLNKYRAVGVFQRLRNDTLRSIENSEVVSAILGKIQNYNSEELNPSEEFVGVLRDYQITGYRWMKTLKNLDFSGVLADDMGLGKTLQAITLLYDEKESLSLVVAPSSLIYNWENEIKRFAPQLRTLVVSGSKSTREELIEELWGYDVVITSYPLLRRDIELYEGINFSLCILDEAQHIKNPESINAQSAKRINAKNRFALTGTPMENSLLELWSIFDFLMPGYLFSRNKFSEKFERPIVREDDDYSLDELKRLISPFILRRKKSDVLLELPDKIETKLVCELRDEQKGVYAAYLAKTMEEIENLIEEEGFERSKLQILSALTRLRQICCHPSVFIENYDGGSGKLDLLEELMEELLEGGHRMLLFSQFTSLLAIIKKLFDEKGIPYMYLDGSTPVEDRMELVERFNSGEGSVFLISLKAGGTGLNLTSADTVIHFDPWWNPAVEDQASDRAHRIGQKKVVQVFKLITKDSIEEKIYELQSKKKDLINSVIQEGETFINTMTREEIMGLLQG